MHDVIRVQQLHRLPFLFLDHLIFTIKPKTLMLFTGFLCDSLHLFISGESISNKKTGLRQQKKNIHHIHTHAYMHKINTK